MKEFIKQAPKFVGMVLALVWMLPWFLASFAASSAWAAIRGGWVHGQTWGGDEAPPRW